MIGALHEDIWGVIAAFSDDTPQLAQTCARLRHIVYDYIASKLSITPMRVELRTTNRMLKFARKHECGICDIIDAGARRYRYKFDIGVCYNCISRVHCVPSYITRSGEICVAAVKIALGMTQLDTPHKIIWPEQQK